MSFQFIDYDDQNGQHKRIMKFIDTNTTQMYSKSWNCQSQTKSPIQSFRTLSYNSSNKTVHKSFIAKPFDPMNKCKAAGIIPYTIHEGKLYFLFQKNVNPIKKKDSGWNDFGGKKSDPAESTIDIASREFSEETNCLFYLKEMTNILDNANNLYEVFKHNDKLEYDDETIVQLKSLIKDSQEFFSKKIYEFVIPMYVNSKETYISYFVKVNYLPAEDIPNSEDLHIYYEDRYERVCKWFSIDDLNNLKDSDFHKRLQITKVLKRIVAYNNKNMFT